MNAVFIIGMKRSGTSILRKLISHSPDEVSLEFEPHDLWFSVMMKNHERYKHLPFVRYTIDAFKAKCQDTTKAKKWYGAKFALLPGVDALNWEKLSDAFMGSKFVFIKRNNDDAYASWMKLDGEKPIAIPYDEYSVLKNRIEKSFTRFCENNQQRGTAIDYDRLVIDARAESGKVWKLLNIRKPGVINGMIKRPENWKNGGK